MAGPRSTELRMTSNGEVGSPMTLEEKYAYLNAAVAQVEFALSIAWSGANVGCAAAAGALQDAEDHLRVIGLDDYANDADARGNEVAGFVPIPWPFIYIALGVWDGPTKRLLAALRSYVFLEGVPLRDSSAANARPSESRPGNSDTVDRWNALSAAQRDALALVGITPELLGLTKR